MKAIAALTFAFGLSMALAPAQALPPAGAGLAAQFEPAAERIDFVQGHEIVAQAPRGRAVSAMAETYFAADLAVTLAALALTGGAFVAFGLSRRRAAPVAKPVAAAHDWEASVMQALEADLADFAFEFRRAA